MYHLSGTNAKEGHCESLQYNAAYAKTRLTVRVRVRVRVFTAASLFYRVNVLAVGRDEAFI